MAEVRLLEGEWRSGWDSFVESAEHKTLFHTSGWMDVISEAFDVETLPYGVFEDDVLAGVFPTFIQRKYGFSFAMSPPWAATPYGGPLAPENLLADTVRGFTESVRDRVGFISIQTPPNAPYGFLGDAGYEVSRWKTVVLDLKPPVEELWNNLESRCRRAVRKSRKEGVEVREVESRDFIEEYYDLVEATYGRQGRSPPNPKKFYYSLWDRFRDSMRFLKAEYDGKAVAGAIFPYYGDTVYYLDGACMPEYYHVSPNNLVHWDLIEWAREEGLRWYDMIGGNIESIARFKYGFGCVDVEHWRGELYTSHVVKALMTAYKRVKGLR